MKSKITLVAAIALVIAVFLSACGREVSSTAPEVGATEATAPEAAISDATTQVPATDNYAEHTDEPVVTPEPEPSIDIEWTKFSQIETDSDGYKYEITYEISPWILLSNTDIVNAVWKEIGNGNEIPSFNSWGLGKASNGLGTYYARNNMASVGSYTYFIHTMSDMYYCLGTAQIKNITDGWSINSGNPRSVTSTIRWFSDIDYHSSNDSGDNSIGRVFYGNDVKDYAGGVKIDVSMTSDSWGPIPFILMAPENFSPNFPNGEYLDGILNGYLHCTDSEDNISIGVIGKDAEYFTLGTE